jgi:hypothetical protein
MRTPTNIVATIWEWSANPEKGKGEKRLTKPQIHHEQLRISSIQIPRLHWNRDRNEDQENNRHYKLDKQSLPNSVSILKHHGIIRTRVRHAWNRHVEEVAQWFPAISKFHLQEIFPRHNLSNVLVMRQILSPRFTAVILIVVPDPRQESHEGEPRTQKRVGAVQASVNERLHCLEHGFLHRFHPVVDVSIG